MSNIFIVIGSIQIVMGIVVVVSAKSSWWSLLILLLGPFLLMGSLIWGLRHLVNRYVSFARVTPEGLEVTRGQLVTLHPWATVGKIEVVPFVQPALWAVRFRDGSPTVAFFTEGSSWMLFGLVKAKSQFVDEVRRRAGEAQALAQ